MTGAIIQILLGLVFLLIVPYFLPRKGKKGKQLYKGIRIISIVLGILLVLNGSLLVLRFIMRMFV